MKQLHLTLIGILIPLCLHAQEKQDLSPVIEEILSLQIDDQMTEIQAELEKIKDSAPAAPQRKLTKSKGYKGKANPKESN